MHLTVAEIHLLLEKLGEEVVLEPNERFPYRVTLKGSGYSTDPKISALQAKLSIMLEVASRREGL
jgi:hypothetical protein